MSRRALGTVALAAVLLAAGCQAPVAGPADSGLATDSGPGVADRQPANVTVQNGTLAVDPGVVFARLQTVAGTNVTPPERVRAFGNESDYGNASLGGGGLPPFQEAVGLKTGPVPNASALELQFAGQTSALGTVVVYTGPNATVDDARLLVAHEFVHYIQFEQGRSAQLRRQVAAGTTDGSYVVRSLLEGSAVYTTDAYLRRYTDNGTQNSPVYRAIAEALPPGHVGRYGNSQYVEGVEYVASRVEDPADLPRVYEAPPTTSEQVIHNRTPGEEPAVTLDATVDPAEGWQEVGTDRLGEAFVRTTLAVGVPQARADRAAAGWGNDRLYVYRAPGQRNASYAWTFAWDDAGEAAEFEQALRGYLDARGERRSGRWALDGGLTARVLTPSEQSTVLLLGNGSFVAGTGASVTVG
ncbi:MAG: hypothetical protein V5A13_09970 [Haloarculaceae archaeon]